MKKLLIIALLGILFLSGCTTQPPQESKFKIGGLFGLTGYASFAGEASRNGFVMAIEDSNMRIDYFIEDYQSNPTSAVTAAQKLIEVNQVPIIIGPEWVEFGEVVTPLAENKKTLFVSPWMTMEVNWAKNSRYYFSGTPNERTQIKKKIEYMNHNNIRQLALIYHNNSFSMAEVDLLKDELKDENIQIVLELRTQETATDYRTEILRIKEKNPDAIYTVFATDNGQGVFNKELTEADVNKLVFVTFARAESDILLDNFGSYSDGMVYSAEKKSFKSAEFAAKYKARFGKDPTAISAATSYDMTSLVLQAVKNGAKTSDEIIEYLLKIKDYSGYSNSSVSFNEFGQVAHQEVVLKRINGKTPQIIE